MSLPGKKLYLLDAMALIYRAYYALNKNPRITSKGLNTSAILGFANTLLEVIKNGNPTHLGVAFDTFAPTVRHGDFAEYKANRQRMPEDIVNALPYIYRLVESFNIPVLAVDGFEADDVIGTLAKKAAGNGFQVYMMTSDKDFGQLVDDNIWQYKPGKPGVPAEVLDKAAICDRFGISSTSQVIDILGLWGDTSDNIPGVPGVGEVTARKLISEFGSVENLIANADTIANEKLREKIKTYADQALMSKQLATIITDVAIPFDEEALKLVTPDYTAMNELFDELEFRTFQKRVQAEYSRLAEDSGGEVEAQPDLFSETGAGKAVGSLETARCNYHLVTTPEERAELIRKLGESGHFCFDTETTGLEANLAELVGLSFAVKPGEAWYVPIPENYNEAFNVVSEFREVFADERVEKTGQNLKYDIAVLRWYEVEVNGKLFDTMIAHYLLEPDQRHGMDYLALTYLNYRTVPIEDLLGKRGKNQLSMRQLEAAQIRDYACEDADITLQLRAIFEPQLAETQTRELFDNIEMPLVKVLADMEAEGVKIDIGSLNAYSAELETDIAALERTICDMAGYDFNIASPRQLGEVLFEKLKLDDKPKKTKTKQYSTGEEILLKLAHKHPIIGKILEYRSLTKLKSTYVDALPLLVNARTGRVHTTYNQAVASTGRLSSNNPNLQNIPIRTEKGREIRKAFVPRNGSFTLISADYSQIELRLIAHISRDPSMLEAFRNNMDIHAATAAKVYHVPLENVTRDMRRNAKTTNFGIIYGISSFGLSERLGIPRKEASDIIRQYFEEFPGIKAYMDDTIAFARENGYVETLLKRRRYLRDINSANANVRGFAERNAINAPIQGSSADMIKIAMIDIHREMTRRNYRSRMILQVHDELVFDVYKTELEELKTLIHDKMRDALKLSIPVVVEVSEGSNWLAAH